MIKCKKCGYTLEYSGTSCPMCRERLEFDRKEYDSFAAIYDNAIKNNDYMSATEALAILADGGFNKYRRLYAELNERGEYAPKNIEKAMRYYLLAAYDNDPYCAYRYSRLLARYTKDQSKHFWLCYSALLGEVGAYPETSDYLFEIGENGAAMYFLRKHFEKTGDTDTLLAIIRRYAEGDGVAQSNAYARWYSDKFKFPPLGAIKLLFGIRAYLPKEPPALSESELIPLTKQLYNMAKRYGYKPMYYHLCELLANHGDRQSTLELCALIYNGEGTAQDKDKGEAMLKTLSEAGYAEAYLYLGEIYMSEESKKDIDLAIDYFIKAGHLGLSIGYETAADILSQGKGIRRDIERAIEIYSLGAEMGDSDCKKKMEIYVGERATIYEKAVLENDVTESFRLIAISAAMGYTRAIIALAKCYEEGIGVKRDRQTAFYWYCRAAKSNDKDALYELGRVYAGGIGTSFDFDKAQECFIKSDKGGNKQAKGALIALYERKKKRVIGTLYALGAELVYNKKYREAKAPLETAANAGHKKAAYLLGALYEFGLFGKTDLEMAKKCYQRAHMLGFFDAGTQYKKKILRIIKKNFL